MEIRLMEIKEIMTESVTKLIEGTGAMFDIKESTVTLTKENKVSCANGTVYDKEKNYVGSYSYTQYGGLSISSNSVRFSTLEITVEVLEYIRKMEEQI